MPARVHPARYQGAATETADEREARLRARDAAARLHVEEAFRKDKVGLPLTDHERGIVQFLTAGFGCHACPTTRNRADAEAALDMSAHERSGQCGGGR